MKIRDPHMVAVAGGVVLSLFLSTAALLLAAGVLGAPPSSAAAPHVAAPAAFDAQAEAFILQNPEVMIESFRRFETARLAQMSETERLIRQFDEQIFRDPMAPVAGNPEGDATVVQFFDYNCPYCRKAVPVLDEAMARDDGLRMVYKEFPILGPHSEFAARAALAAERQGKYLDLHMALMKLEGRADREATLDAARRVGLDVERLMADMEDPAVTAAIERNLELAGELGITGTPSFVAKYETMRGLADLPRFEAYVEAARAAEARP